jgi:hypothetical protein
MSMDSAAPRDLLGAVDAFLHQCRCEAEVNSWRTYWQTHPCIATAEMQLLAALVDEPLCAEACARWLGQDAESVRALLDALVGVGLLDRRDERYAASPATMLYCRTFLNGVLSLPDDRNQ